MKKFLNQTPKYLFVTLLFYALFVAIGYLIFSLNINVWTSFDYLILAVIIGLVFMFGIACLLVKFSKKMFKLKSGILALFIIIPFVIFALGIHVLVMSKQWSDYTHDPYCASIPCNKMNFIEFYIHSLAETFG